MSGAGKASSAGPGRAYDRLGERFERVMNRYDLERRLALVLDRVPSEAGVRALEVGCGVGYLSQRLRVERGVRAVSLDIGRTLLRVARGAARVTLPVCGDALALPFPDASFELVVSSECIEHTPSPSSALAEMARVAAPGALLVVTCPNAAWHWSVRLANALRLRPYEGLENWPGFDELRGWAERAGFAVTEHVGFHVLPFQLPLARAWLPVADRIVLRAVPGVAINQLLVARKVA